MSSFRSASFVLLLATLLTSCSSSEESVFERLRADYAGDTLRQAAVSFLEKYADSHAGISYQLIDSNGGNAEHVNPLDFSTDTAYLEFLQFHQYHFEKRPLREDREKLTEAFLRENIDLAFDAWRAPWSRAVPFADFCRYILPYRNADEALSDWRKEFKEKYFASITDSVANPKSKIEVALYLMRRLKEEVAYGQKLRSFYPYFLTPEQCRQMHFLECRQLAHYGTLALRACGVPCAMIETHWRFTDIAHTSILIPQLEGDTAAFRLSVYDELQVMGTPKDSMASWRTWRYSYETNPELAAMKHSLPGFSSFYSPVTRIDETPIFSTTHSFSMPVPDSLQAQSYLFLCRMESGKWFGIREGLVSGDSVTFRNATIRQWYRMGYFNGDDVTTFGSTFTLTGDGRVQYYDCSGDTVFFKLVYSCPEEETRTHLSITTQYWGSDNCWHSLNGDAVLWGYNETSGEYKEFDESMRGRFKPVFHLLKVWLPRWTVFYDETMPRPLGFICQDAETGEGYLMQF